MKKVHFKLIIASICLFAHLGCSTGPYVRSDVFLDTELVRSIYVMPVVTEITIDSGLTMSSSELKAGINEAKERIGNLINIELSRRGYAVEGYNKEFLALDKSDPKDRLVKMAVMEFVHSSSTHSDVDNAEEALIKTLLEQLVASSNVDITDQHGKKVTVNKGNIYTNTALVDDPLVLKTQKIRKYIPADFDTVLYVHVKSTIAKRGIFHNLNEKSSANVRMKMVNLDKEKVIFSDSESEIKTDILHWKSFKDNITNILVRIPVKF